MVRGMSAVYPVDDSAAVPQGFGMALPGPLPCSQGLTHPFPPHMGHQDQGHGGQMWLLLSHRLANAWLSTLAGPDDLVSYFHFYFL